MALTGCRVQGGASVVVLHVGVGTGVEQRGDGLGVALIVMALKACGVPHRIFENAIDLLCPIGVALKGCDVQGSVPVVVLHVGVGAGVEQRGDVLDMALTGCPVQGGGSGVGGQSEREGKRDKGFHRGSP